MERMTLELLTLSMVAGERMKLPRLRSSGLKATAFGNPTIRSKAPREKQYYEDDQDDADHTDAAMTVTIPVTTKATAETTKQKDDKEDDEYEPDRHDLPPVERLSALTDLNQR
jgi:hypothetical protein